MRILKKYKHDQDGATAVEAAIVFPILIMCLFFVFGMGTFMFGTHQAQRSVESTARKARVVDQPSQTDLLALLTTDLKDAPFGSYTPQVIMLTQHGGEYAELQINYTFNFDFPFLKTMELKKTAKTQVKLREMPA